MKESVKKLFRKVEKLFYDKEIDFRERLFRNMLAVGTSAALVSIAAGLRMDNIRIMIVPLLLIVLVMGIALLATFRFRKIEFAACLTGALILCVIFPLVFFLSGGIDSGSTVWFVLGLVYIFLLFSGRKLAFFIALALTAYISTYVVGYLHPEWIIPLERRMDVFYDSAFAVLAVGFATGILMKFQNRVYENERQVAVQKSEELEAVSRSKDDFFANMSHEIRTPINTIIGLNEMILREELSDDIAENAVNIQNASKMLLTLINDILDLSKIESGKMEIVPVQYETSAMFSDLVNIIWIRAHEKNLEFKINIDDQLPSMLYGDEVRIKQVLVNILTNAVKYTKSGSVTLSAQSELIDTNHVRLQISVADTGIGIKKENLDDLFQTFKRVDEEKNRKIEGTGLGLSISKQLIELMGGQITVDSIYTKGSTFTVILEQEIVNPEPVGSLNYIARKRAGNRKKYSQSFEAPEARILIVDDNEMNLLVAGKLLRSTKVQVDTAKSGRECLKKTKQKYYHVIFMDHMMPEMDGEETMRLLRKQENGLCRESPVIALTANAFSGSEQRYKEMGFQDYLAKPISGPLLEATLVRYLPEDIVEYKKEQDTEEQDFAGVKMLKGGRKKKLCIATESPCDLPEELVKRYDIKLMYYYIITESGRFCDRKEVSSDNLQQFLLTQGKTAETTAASVEEYEAFFAEALTEYEEIIHISVSSRLGEGYQNAVRAAKGFDHVHVIDSHFLTGGLGFFVLKASVMAKAGWETQKICDLLEKDRSLISCSMIVRSLETMYHNKRVNRFLFRPCEYFGLHMAFGFRRNDLRPVALYGSRLEQAWKRYIRMALHKRKKIDKSVLFLIHSGCSVKEQEWILKEVKKYVSFEKIYIQKASATNMCNVGIGTFGLMFQYQAKEGGKKMVLDAW